MRTVYLIQLQQRWESPTYLTAFHANVSTCFFLRCLYNMSTRNRRDPNFIFFQSLLIFLSFKEQAAEVFWREMNWTDHRVFGCCPVLPRGIHERNPLSPSFHSFWSWIVKKGNCMDRNAFFLIFRVTTAIHNTLLYHFFVYNWQCCHTKKWPDREIECPEMTSQSFPVFCFC